MTVPAFDALGDGSTIHRPHGLRPRVQAGGPRTTLAVNGTSIIAYEYATPEDAARDAATVQPTGWMIGHWVIEWVDRPQFYRSGQLIVVYVGRDGQMVGLLNGVLGLPFAQGA